MINPVYDVEALDGLLESNNYELFNSAGNCYIKGAVKFRISDKICNELYFVKITVQCSSFADTGSDFSWDEYGNAIKSFTLLSLVGNISLSMKSGWLASDWVYIGNGGRCSCVISRRGVPDAGKTDEFAIKINDVVTFGSEEDAYIEFDFYGLNSKHLYNEAFRVAKTFDSDSQSILKASKYALAKGDKSKLLWVDYSNGIATPNQKDVKPFFEQSAYKTFTASKLSCNIFYMPPTVNIISIDKDKVFWDVSYYTSAEIALGSETFSDVTSENFYKITGKKFNYVHLRFKGYLYQIDEVFYVNENNKAPLCFLELKQTVYCFNDSGCRLMRLDWTKKTNNDDFKVFVRGTAATGDYYINTEGKNFWEFPFQYAGEDYTEMILTSGSDSLTLIL